MTISLDYDDTYTRDPELWEEFIVLATRLGHRVVCVTSRTEADRGIAELALKLDAVIFAGATPKREAARALGIEPAIWIDDSPETIGTAWLIGGKP